MENSTIIIGGISGGIGSALAKKLVNSGHTVVGFARDQKRLDALKEKHPEIKTHICNATDPEAIKAYFDEISSSYEQISAYVHAIGSIFLKPAHLTSDEDWNRTHRQILVVLFTHFGLLQSK